MLDEPVILIGDANVDVLLHVDHYPEVGGDARSERMKIQLGGSAANTSVVLRRLDVPCKLLTTVGEDQWADRVLDDLHSVGVDTSMIGRIGADDTGLMFIPVTPAGERTIFGRRGANRRFSIGERELSAIKAAPLLHVSGYAFYQDPQRSSTVQAVQAAVRSQTAICLDTAYGPAIDHPERLLSAARQAQILILGEDEARRIARADTIDSAVEQLRTIGPQWIALKRGARGVKLVDRSSTADLPATDVDVIDSTGAGDAFTAGIIFGWLNDWELGDAGLLAVVLGGIATTVTGAGLAIPERERIRQALRASAESGPYSDLQRRRLDDFANQLAD